MFFESEIQIFRIRQRDDLSQAIKYFLYPHIYNLIKFVTEAKKFNFQQKKSFSTVSAVCCLLG